MRSRLLIVALAACGTDVVPPEPPPPTIPPPVVYLTPTEHLIRASMTLRGRRPSIDELEQVAADPDALPGIVDGYLATPEFGDVMRDLHAETLLVRVDLQNRSLRPIPPVADRTAGELLGVYEEPLKLIEHVIMNDRPYTEIVTATYTLATPTSAGVWGVTIPGNGGWEVGQWQDNRSVAGIISSSALMVRHTSAGANYHRGRANMLSSALLCFDYLHSDIILDTSIDLANPDVVSDALRDSPACAGCHQTLDPLASFLWGIQEQGRYNTYPVPMYRPGDLGKWATTTERPPALSGQAGTTLADLGQLIANDPRFPRCAAARFAAYFTQRDRTQVPFEWVAQLTESFVDAGLDAKHLAREIVLSDEFRVSHVTADASEEFAEGLRGMLRARPEQLDTMMTDLTGFRWITDSTMPLEGAPYGKANLLRTDYLGYRALAGGIDSYFVTKPTYTTNAVGSLVLRAFAASAAGFVVDADFDGAPTQRRLLEIAETEIGETAIRAQLAKLHLRIYGTADAPDGTAVGETYGVFAAVHATTNSVRHAWKTTLTAMLGDLRVAYY